MTNAEFSALFREALESDQAAFLAAHPDAGEICTAAHRSVREIRAAAGMTQADLAAHFAMPKRTIENWEADGAAARSCAPYIRLMMQEALGLVRIERE